MKKLSILFAVLFLVFFTTHIFAQKKAKQREVIVIEITTPNKNIDRQEVLINRTPKTNYEIGGGGANGGGSVCGDCSPKESEEINKKYKAQLRKLSYGFTAKAWRMGKNKSNLSFGISVGEDNCQTQKIFTVYRNQQTKIQLNCGVSLIAYYGLKNEEGN
jgi:Na+-transporting NADH:ubiquinone oxidoreductase subunit NqrF